MTTASPHKGHAPDAFSLSDATPGHKVRLASVDEHPGLRMRLAAMGMLPGVEMLVVRNSGRGPCVVEVRGARIMLGRGMALKMMVRPLRAAKVPPA
ncbi:MAG TPA: FeoA family protein [Candidatus Brocadiia bacterium]|nr:FeoA family protein [Candidatus Brocadiia bacterium]